MERERIRGENEWAEMFTPAPSVQLVQVPLAQLVPWEQADGSPQPFKPYTQEKLGELADSIRQHGVLEAIRVRPRNGKFQILAGHNRSQAARMAGLTTIPAIVEDVDDDQAALILVDSNLQHREKLLPSEKAWAYRTRLEAMKRQGARTDLTSGQVGPKFRSDEEVAQNVGESRKQVQRYIRLTYLNPLLLDLVDQEKIGMTPGVELTPGGDGNQRNPEDFREAGQRPPERRFPGEGRNCPNPGADREAAETCNNQNSAGHEPVSGPCGKAAPKGQSVPG